jgi:biotin carboxyl carrier protein
MRYEVHLAGRSLHVDIDAAGRWLIDGRAVPAEVDEIVRGRQWLVRLEGRVHEITVLTHEPLRLLVDGRHFDATAADERTLAASRGTPQHATGRHELRAPMPGLLRAVHVKEGDIVEQGAPLVTLEAMKMENELRAPSRGRVVKVAAAAGDKVEGGAPLLVIADSDP